MAWENFPDAQEWESHRWRWRWRHKKGDSSVQPEERSCGEVESRDTEMGEERP